MNYYNENNPKMAAWIRQLEIEGLIPRGKTDERSIAEIRKSDLDGYSQFHTFCGIAGWPLALGIAGWPEDEPVWTGSCPCQPFSSGGKGAVDKDERHVWPDFRAAIAECRPPAIFGEQVARKDGRIWLANVRSDLEALGYGVGAADLCAASVGAPHIRSRIWWFAYPKRDERKIQSCRREVGRVGREFQSVPWNEPWKSALCRLRALDDGLSYGVEGCDGPRNAIVPFLAAQFVMACMDVLHFDLNSCDSKDQ